MRCRSGTRCKNTWEREGKAARRSKETNAGERSGWCPAARAIASWRTMWPRKLRPRMKPCCAGCARRAISCPSWMFVADATAFASEFFGLSGRRRPGALTTSKDSVTSEPLGVNAMSA
eukprot:5770135-Pyramimonas_sp.AAC.1